VAEEGTGALVNRHPHHHMRHVVSVTRIDQRTLDDLARARRNGAADRVRELENALALPTASTCYAHLHVPDYPSEEIMARKLRAAIVHCGDIDNDTTHAPPPARLSLAAAPPPAAAAEGSGGSRHQLSRSSSSLAAGPPSAPPPSSAARRHPVSSSLSPSRPIAGPTGLAHQPTGRVVPNSGAVSEASTRRTLLPFVHPYLPSPSSDVGGSDDDADESVAARRRPQQPRGPGIQPDAPSTARARPSLPEDTPSRRSNVDAYSGAAPPPSAAATPPAAPPAAAGGFAAGRMPRAPRRRRRGRE
jgi:hypothetical protein